MICEAAEECYSKTGFPGNAGIDGTEVVHELEAMNHLENLGPP